MITGLVQATVETYWIINCCPTQLFLQSTDAAGFERAVQLFPTRMGMLSPDWLVDGRADVIGAAGVQGAGYVSSFPSPALVAYHFFTVSMAGCLQMRTINT